MRQDEEGNDMGEWNSDKKSKWRDGSARRCSVVGWTALMVWIFAALLAVVTMDFNVQAGCNIPADKRTEQQNRDCGQ